MTKSYFKVMFFIFGIAITFGLALRIILKLTGIDPQTGFYTGGYHLDVAFGLVTGLAFMLLIFINTLRATAYDYPVRKENGIVPFLAIIAGASIIAFILFGFPERLGLPSPYVGEQTEGFMRNLSIALGLVSGAAFILEGLMGLLFKKSIFALLSIVAPVWQILLLLSRFNGYHSILYVSDHMLIVGFMLSVTLFYLGRARTVYGQARKDGRNYVISAGLCTALTGTLVVIPNYVYMFINKSGMPVDLLSIPESIYISALSLYSFCFVISYTKTIRKV